MVSLKNDNLSASEGLVIFSTSKLLTCFIAGFTSKVKSRSVVDLLNGNEHINWILNLDDEVHSMWVIWTSGFQECQDNFIVSKSGGMGNNFSVGI